ncbi:hypothetical protein AAFF_G00024620 [Aldrovandia affinis]|uniref:Uncharacterized protein n=1 Tax=Aldrovandia affinis TaxID=143900 RepID=A0AAD7T5T1_9TELE|nr:hypothetical protein AAFF_G00024620 [Aldrovandia affinis]
MWWASGEQLAGLREERVKGGWARVVSGRCSVMVLRKPGWEQQAQMELSSSRFPGLAQGLVSAPVCCQFLQVSGISAILGSLPYRAEEQRGEGGLGVGGLS